MAAAIFMTHFDAEQKKLEEESKRKAEEPDEEGTWKKFKLPKIFIF